MLISSHSILRVVIIIIIEDATDHQRYLGFSWVDSVSKRAQILLIYGLALWDFLRATYFHCSSETDCEAVEVKRSMQVALFLDDGWSMASTRDACASLSKTVKVREE